MNKYIIFKKAIYYTKRSQPNQPTNTNQNQIYQYIHIYACNIAYCMNGWPWGLWESLRWNIIPIWPDDLWTALTCHGNGSNGHEAFAASICYMECNDIPLAHFFWPCSGVAVMAHWPICWDLCPESWQTLPLWIIGCKKYGTPYFFDRQIIYWLGLFKLSCMMHPWHDLETMTAIKQNHGMQSNLNTQNKYRRHKII